MQPIERNLTYTYTYTHTHTHTPTPTPTPTHGERECWTATPPSKGSDSIVKRLLERGGEQRQAGKEKGRVRERERHKQEKTESVRRRKDRV